jgi:Protein of unknown function (DUF664)
LSFARHCVLKKAGGLSDEQLRRVLTGSGTSILGLVQHLAEAERYWFGHHLAGAAWDTGQEYGMAVPGPPRRGRRAGRLPGGHQRQRPRDLCRRRPASTLRRPVATRKHASPSGGDPQARFAVRSTATGTRCGGSWPT